MSELAPLDQYLNECEANPGRKFASTPGYPTGILCPCKRGELMAFIGGDNCHSPGLTATFCRECGTERSIPSLPPIPSERLFWRAT